MAKIKDLGISVIPVAMQPPGIGAGGGSDAGADSRDEERCGKTLSSDEDEERCGKTLSSDEPETISRDEEYETISAADDDPCGQTLSTEPPDGDDDDDDQGGHHPRKAEESRASLSGDRVAQLKAQLESHISRPPEK